ncbi:DUF547 domain-containing protein [Nonlabens marinus]|nr:DUF547 domain-containing protein [Nonlabens marinus]
MKLKNIMLMVVMLGSFAFAKAQLSTFNTATKELFQARVMNGKVDYAAIKKDSKTLNTALNALMNIDLASLNANERKALFINAYNVFTIKGIVDAYPTASVMDINNFFDAKNYELGKKKVSLNELEKEMLFKEFSDARLHFVLVCGAVSCPPLQEKPFTAENVEFLLKKQTKAAINNPAIVKLDMHEKKAIVSKIFDWYNADFTKKQTLTAYINTYRENAIPDGFKVEYMDYDWSLNGK